jgi:pimeloyl-ACP methyl ester carboxylesterase
MVKLVLLPGMDGTGDLFHPFVAALGKDHEVQIVRHPPHESLDYPALTDHVREVLPRSGRYVLLGESFSGPLAIALAAERPAGLDGLVLCCSFARNPRPWLGWLRFLLNLSPPVVPPVRLLGRWLLGSHATPALLESLSTALAKVAPTVMRQRLAAVLSVDVTVALRSVAVPILYLRAAHDRLVPRGAAAAISLVQPATRIVEIPGPHLLLQTAPAEAAGVVCQFLREVGAS